MNSFVPFSPKEPKFLFSLNTFPRLSIPSSVSTNSPHSDISTFSGFFNSSNPYSPSNSGLKTPTGNNSICLSPLSFSPLKGSPPSLSPTINNFLMTVKLQQSLQTEAFKAQMQQLEEIKVSLLQKLNQQQMQIEACEKQQSSNNERKVDLNPVKIEATNIALQIIQQGDSINSKKGIKAQIRDITIFVLDNFGRVSESCFEQEKLKYSTNKDLITIFDLLCSKYASTIKTKEEMVKYTLRRAFKFIKSTLKKETQTNTKGVSKTICNKYFKASEEDISKVGSEEDFLKIVLPFRKHSKNKTMNTTFINEVFKSENFSSDYQKYLKSFDGILETDNKNKIERFITFIEGCLNKKKFADIKTYKRIPWPRLWVTNTKNIAQALPTLSSQSLEMLSNPNKKCKLEEDFNSNRSVDEECVSKVSTESVSSN